jgi:hypothetical protein
MIALPSTQGGKVAERRGLAPTGLPFKEWIAFAFAFPSPLPADRIPLDLEKYEQIPDRMAIGGIEARPVILAQQSPELDLYPLTVPHGFRFRQNLAVLFTQWDESSAWEMAVGAGADWYMAWACNSALALSTFRTEGNKYTPVRSLDHDVTLSLRKGSNLVAVAVLCGVDGFQLKCELAPPNLESRRLQAAREAQDRQHRLAVQLEGPGFVEVRCVHRLSECLRSERYQSTSLSMMDAEATSRWVEAIGRPHVLRCFGAIPEAGLTRGSEVGESQSVDKQLQAASEFCQRMMAPLPIAGAIDVIEGRLPEEEYVRRVEAALLRLRRHVPNADLIEAYNESETGGHALSVDQYYRMYRLICKAVHRANRQSDGPPLLVGGPTPCSFNLKRIESFLDHYAADASPEKRLDFITYHQYLFGNEHAPAVVFSERAQIRAALCRRGIDVDLPIHVNETGVFPGNQGTRNYRRDLLTQAAGSLTLHHYYMEMGQIHPYQWTWFHPNPRKNLFAPTLARLDREGPEDPIRDYLRPFCDHRSDRWTPFGHIARMQRMMERNRLPATSGPRNDEGQGIHARAAADGAKLTILIWHYQFKSGTGPQEIEVRVRVADMPVLGGGRRARWRRFLVDENHSHYASSFSASEEMACVESGICCPEEGFSHGFSLSQNSVVLIVIEPAPAFSRI